MEKKTYFLQQYLREEYNHGGIGCVDAEKIFVKKGYKPILFPGHYSFSIQSKTKRLLFLLKMFFTIRKGSVVLLVYPFYATMNRLLVRLLLFKPGVKLICFIVDIDGIKDGDPKKLEKEIGLFRKLRHFIVLNERMKEWLHAAIGDNNSSKINFHSFLAEPVSASRKKSFTVVFAGNLDKSGFLTKLHLLHTRFPQLHFNLYGPADTSIVSGDGQNVTWCGVAKPYEMPAALTGSFGLVWDGESIDKPDGSLGHYSRYISPHKLSLYILSGLPVIVWEEAATADLVKKYNIGFTVKTLYELESKINALTADEYFQMQINMRPLAQKVSRGEFLEEAIDEIMNLTG